MQGQGIDPRTLRAVLGLVLYEHPGALSVERLKCEVGDDAQAAVTDLADAGLLALDNGAVRATRAAVVFDRLAL